MKLRNLMAASVAGVLAIGTMAVNVAAADATGDPGMAGIAFAGGDWTAQYWLDGKTYPSTITTATITGDGQYTVTATPVAEFEDEETGEMVQAPGTTSLAFAALQVVDGETLFPGMIITIDSVKFDGTEMALAGTPYTSSDEKITTRVNLFNSWVSALPEDARTIDGLAADATPVAINAAELGEWTTMEVTFTVSGTGVTAEVPAETATADAATAEDTAAADDTTGDAVIAPAPTTDEKGSPDTGVEGIAAVAGVAVLAAGAIVLSKKRK